MSDIIDDRSRDDGSLFDPVEQIPVPDLWPEIRSRAATQHRRRAPLAAAAAVAALFVGAAWGLDALADHRTPPIEAGQTTEQTTDDVAEDTIGVIVWMEPTASEEAIDEVAALLDADQRVKRATYVDRAETYQEFAQLADGEPELETVTENDLPTSFRIVLVRDGTEHGMTTDYSIVDGVREVTTWANTPSLLELAHRPIPGPVGLHGTFPTTSTTLTSTTGSDR